jgi:hypothetical protein
MATERSGDVTILNPSELARTTYHSHARVERSLQRKVRRLFWLLIAIGLVPGIALVSRPDSWRLLPPGVQWSAYLLSLILAVAAWSLRFEEGSTSEEGS